MASRIVKALKNAKSSLKSQNIEEPEIVAVIPPPQGPKRSQPPPTPPAAKQQHQARTPPPPPSVQLQPSPPLSPIVQKFEETKLSGGGEVPGFFLAELPDTSITRPRSQDEKEKQEDKSKEAPEPPVEEVKEEGEEHVGDEGARGKGLGKELKEKKKKDPAVLVEIPKSPSAQAYEVAHAQKLQDQYFNPVFEDESRTPRDGAAPPSPEKVAETLKAVVDPTVAS